MSEATAGKSVLKWLRRAGVALAGLVGFLITVWAAAALYVDLPIAWLRLPAALLYVLIVVVAAWRIRWGRGKALAVVACFCIVLAWWLSIPPSRTGDWQADVSKVGWIDISGDEVTIHDLRNCDYRTELDYTCAWETRKMNLSQLRGLDLFVDYWGSPWIAHPLLSFDFGDGGHVVFSIETRKKVGQSYSALLGFFRQYELIILSSDERDVIRLRTNYRAGEDVYLFRTNAGPELTKELFLGYVSEVNRLHANPRWYNAITNNCTTNIFAQQALKSRPWDYRILLNGKGDEMEYERGDLATDNLPFAELKARAHINPAAKAADQDPEFSKKVRVDRPGFENLQ